MSEVDAQPRDEATGQFTINTEGMVGRELTNAEAGFRTKKDPPTEEKTYPDTLEGVKEAAADLQARRGTGPFEIDVDVLRVHNGKPDPKEAVTIDQAAKELASARGDVGKYVEGYNLQAFAEQIDKARAAEMKANPRAAAELGLSDEDVEAAKKADEGEEKTVAKDQRPDTAVKPDRPGQEPVAGLDPEVEKALKHPQVRQAIEQELGKAEQSQQQYAAAVNYANQFAQASLVDALPELGQIPVENWEAAIGLLAQSDPGRVQRALGIIQRVSNLSAAQMQLQQHQAHVQRQQFVTSTEAEDARLVEVLGEEAADEANKATVSFLTDHGIPRHQAFEFIQRHPVMATAAARETIWKAQQYDAMNKAAKTISAKPLPPVQRPGVAAARPVGADNRGKIAALQAKLEGATGNQAAKIAAQIRTLRSR